MEEQQTIVTKHPIDLSLLADTFGIRNNGDCLHLNEWLSAQYAMNNVEEAVLSEVFQRTNKDIYYYNEEELKIQLVALLFFIANIDVEERIKVFYERPLQATIGQHKLSVITDCMVATPMRFNKPKKPYFFLQEFKKGKGDDKDPEAQMLAAMIIAQYQNQDDKPIYGSFIIGSNWWFTTLIGKEYCLSREFNTNDKADLVKIIYALRSMKELIMKR